MYRRIIHLGWCAVAYLLSLCSCQYQASTITAFMTTKPPLVRDYFIALTYNTSFYFVF